MAAKKKAKPSKKAASKVKVKAKKAPDVVALLNAELEGFNDKRVMESDEDQGAWVIDAVQVKGKKAIVSAHDNVQRVKLEVPIRYEIIEEGNHVDAQFGVELMTALFEADQARAPKSKADPAEAKARQLLKKADAQGLAAHLTSVDGRIQRGILKELLDYSESPNAAAKKREAFAAAVCTAMPISHFDDLKAELFLFALWTGQEELMNRVKPRIAASDLRPYGPIASVIRSWEMRGLKPSLAAASSSLS